MKDIPFAITTMRFDEIPEFRKDRKRLQKKYLSLQSDISEFQSVLSAVPLGNSKHFNVITQVDTVYIVKARLFCRYLKGSSMRVVYAYNSEQQKIEFIELYFKGDKENEDKGRIENYLRSLYH